MINFQSENFKPQLGQYIFPRNNDPVLLNTNASLGQVGIITNIQVSWISFNYLDANLKETSEKHRCRFFIAVCDTLDEIRYLQKMQKMFEKNVETIKKMHADILTEVFNNSAALKHNFLKSEEANAMLQYDIEPILFGEES